MQQKFIKITGSTSHQRSELKNYIVMLTQNELSDVSKM